MSEMSSLLRDIGAAFFSGIFEGILWMASFGICIFEVGELMFWDYLTKLRGK